jgi:hypothetical protein
MKQSPSFKSLNQQFPTIKQGVNPSTFSAQTLSSLHLGYIFQASNEGSNEGVKRRTKPICKNQSIPKARRHQVCNLLVPKKPKPFKTGGMKPNCTKQITVEKTRNVRITGKGKKTVTEIVKKVITTVE